MKCDQCDNEATVRETTIEKGVAVEKHLCESCAAKQGLGGQPHTLGGVLKGFVVAPGAGIVIQTHSKAAACPVCRLPYADFKNNGLLGCPHCYRAFEPQLAPLIERAHEGAVKHAGKSPRRASAAPATGRLAGLSMEERAERLRAIRKELDSAVAAEQYELAARLRDELRRLSDASSAGLPPLTNS